MIRISWQLLVLIRTSTMRRDRILQMLIRMIPVLTLALSLRVLSWISSTSRIGRTTAIILLVRIGLGIGGRMVLMLSLLLLHEIQLRMSPSLDIIVRDLLSLSGVTILGRRWAEGSRRRRVLVRREGVLS